MALYGLISLQSTYFLIYLLFFDMTSRIVLAYKNVVLPFFCLQEPIFNILVIFFCFETRGVRVPCYEFIDS